MYMCGSKCNVGIVEDPCDCSTRCCEEPGANETPHRASFMEELSSLINRHSKENSSDTPDFILAEYLSTCLETFNKTVIRREQWYGRQSAI